MFPDDPDSGDPEEDINKREDKIRKFFNDEFFRPRNDTVIIDLIPQ